MRNRVPSKRVGSSGWLGSFFLITITALVLTDWLKPEWTNFEQRPAHAVAETQIHRADHELNFERVLNARYPTISDIKLKSWQVLTLKALGSWRYMTRFYKAPYEIRFVANRLFRYRQPEVEGF